MDNQLQASLPPAGKWPRLFASIGDNFFIGSIAFGLQTLFLYLLAKSYEASPNSPSLEVLAILVGISTIVLLLIYWIGITIWKGGTLGKRFYGLKIISYETKNRPRPIQIWVRELIRIIYKLPLVGIVFFLMDCGSILWDKERRSLRDKVAKTTVIKSDPVWPFWKQLLFILTPLIILGISVAAWFNLSKLTNGLIYPSIPSETSLPSPKSIDTSTWQTYLSLDDHFSFSHPSDWTAPKIQPMFNDNLYDFQSSGLSIDVVKSTTYENLIKLQQQTIQTPENITVSGFPAKKYINTIGSSTFEPTVYINGPNNITYRVTMTLPQGIDINLFDLILSTFKITNQ